MGLLTNPGPQPWHPAHDDTKLLCKQASDYCIKNNVELGKLAVYYALKLKGPTTFLIGMQSINLLNMNLETYYNGLTDKEHDILNQITEMFYLKLKNKHWEGIEVERYWEAMKK